MLDYTVRPIDQTAANDVLDDLLPLMIREEQALARIGTNAQYLLTVESVLSRRGPLGIMTFYARRGLRDAIRTLEGPR